MKRKSAVAVACLTFFLCMTTVTHAKETVSTTRVNTVAKTGWQYTNDNWYYYDANGNIQTGWISYGGHKYYLHPNGTMAKGWVFTDGHYQYLNNFGIQQFGWQMINGNWYHFRAGGAHDYTQTTAPTLTYDNGYYVSPMKTGTFNTSAERIEAMIARAYEYLGTTYRICTSSYPGDGVDCSGLVMQALYAAGFDPYPATPSHHAKPENEYDSRTLWAYTPMAHVSTSDLRRGDLVFYSSGPYAPIFHVAIYLGNGKVIEAWPPYVTDTCGVTDWPHPYILGVARPFE